MKIKIQFTDDQEITFYNVCCFYENSAELVLMEKGGGSRRIGVCGIMEMWVEDDDMEPKLSWKEIRARTRNWLRGR